jgi:hypothetical protein
MRKMCHRKNSLKATLVDCCKNVRRDLSYMCTLHTRGFVRHFASMCLNASLCAVSNPSANKQSSWFTGILLEIISPNCETEK